MGNLDLGDEFEDGLGLRLVQDFVEEGFHLGWG